jgi:membrane glycosyltransferase
MARVEEADSLEDVLSALSRTEKAAVLGDARGLDRLLALAGRR